MSCAGNEGDSSVSFLQSITYHFTQRGEITSYFDRFLKNKNKGEKIKGKKQLEGARPFRDHSAISKKCGALIKVGKEKSDFRVSLAAFGSDDTNMQPSINGTITPARTITISKEVRYHRNLNCWYL